jgi:hypothetical protein
MNGRYRWQLLPFILRQAQDERKQLWNNGMFYISRSPNKDRKGRGQPTFVSAEVVGCPRIVLRIVLDLIILNR